MSNHPGPAGATCGARAAGASLPRGSNELAIDVTERPEDDDEDKHRGETATAQFLSPIPGDQSAKEIVHVLAPESCMRSS